MNKSGVAAQVISHPQGGGAIKGLGDPFSPDLHTGTGNLTVPIAIVRDPDDTLRAYSWSLTETSDPFGNRIEYLYERQPVSDDGAHRWDQIYLKSIRYADYGAKEAPQYLVTVEFVYDPRPDPFSTYRAGFEIRTTRRCARIEVRTHANMTPRTARKPR